MLEELGKYDTIKPVASLAGIGGAMAIYKRGKKWEVNVPTSERYENGRKKHYRETVDTKKEAIKREKELIEEFRKVMQDTLEDFQDKEKPVSISFTDAVEEWLNMKKFEVRKTTFSGYKIILEKHLIPHFRGRDIAEVTETDVRAYLAEKFEALSSTTLRHHYSVLSMILEFNNNFCMRKIKRPQNSSFQADPIKNLEDLEELINILKNVIAYLPSKIAASTGMRLSEIAGLQWRDFDAEKAILRVRRSLHYEIKDGKKGDYYIDTTKTKSSLRTIYISREFAKELENIKEERGNQKADDFICVDTNNEPVFRQNIYDSFKRKLKNTKFEKLRFHDLRHSHATIAIHQLNVDAKTVQERLGHSTVVTTLSIYTAKSSEQDKKVAEAFSF